MHNNRCLDEEISKELDEINNVCKSLQAKFKPKVPQNYTPSQTYLRQLRMNNNPFVDIINGKECTVNHKNSWKNYLILSEVLESFSPDNKLAWKKLVQKLKDEPTVGIEWLTAKRNLKNRSPFQFRFGNFKSFKKIRGIIEVACPDVKLPIPWKKGY